jgi:DMSO/TMAO reductase YedYZ molybdopterin-dependent catalytic subunit
MMASEEDMTVLKRLGTPVFYAEGVPKVNPSAYRLTVDGLVQEEKVFSLDEVKAMRKSVVDARLTSVSGWSVRAKWEGVLFSDFLKQLKLEEGASHATFTSLGNYQSTVSLSDLLHPRVLLVYAVEGEELEIEYGGPVRMVIPQLWGYKSVKGLSRITFTDRMLGGYWEDRGYPRDAGIKPRKILDMNTRTKRDIKGGEVTF